ncbi:MAG TPA: Tm-1-like ATP-binding domain-containing protein [Xanthobacteraceae bacterium]|nr:Tm-1-like ATP-binding domain-containing protein [Xanthobacteraceae bacterium]
MTPFVTVAVLATLDSKHAAIRFMCDALTHAGATPWLVDLSLRPHAQTFADVGGAEVAAAAGADWGALAKMSRAQAAEIMIAGGRKIVAAKLAAGELAGALGLGGANGSTMACAIMRQLPLGLPKIMVTPVAATAAVQWYVAESDIAMMPTIGDISLNRITRAAMTHAAEAMAAMARARHAGDTQRASKAPPLIGISSFGNLQPAVDRITQRLEAQKFEVIHFHASGPGGRALESLAARGELAGVIDLTTSELTDHLTGGVYSAGEGRLTAAAAAGIPQVVVPGCLDFTNWWLGEVPERFRRREFFQYNLEILLMRTNAEEFTTLGRLMGERLSVAKGPVRVLIPLGGFSGLTGRKTHDLERNEIGTWAQPETDRAFVAALRRHLPAEQISELPHHINDRVFADACADQLLHLLECAERGERAPQD